MVSPAVLFGLGTMVFWGLWAIFAKVATRSLLPETAMVISYGASVPIVLAYIAVQEKTVSLSADGVAFALLAGLFGAIGGVCFYAGLSHGRTAIVTTVGALYFLVAALLGVVFFGESIGLEEVAGIGFAVLAVVLFST